jgi:hypothetical protein
MKSQGPRNPEFIKLNFIKPNLLTLQYLTKNLLGLPIMLHKNDFFIKCKFLLYYLVGYHLTQCVST